MSSTIRLTAGAVLMQTLQEHVCQARAFVLHHLDLHLPANTPGPLAVLFFLTHSTRLAYASPHSLLQLAAECGRDPWLDQLQVLLIDWCALVERQDRIAAAVQDERSTDQDVPLESKS